MRKVCTKLERSGNKGVLRRQIYQGKWYNLGKLVDGERR